MTRTPAGLLDDALRADAARPYITWLDAASGARVELSGSTLDNWVAKTANLVRDGFGIESGERVFLAPSAHWFTAVWLLAVWRAGSVVDLDSAGGSALAVGGEARLTSVGPLPRDVLVLSDHPLGLASAPPSTLGPDFTVDVQAQPDRFIPFGTPSGDDTAVIADGRASTSADLVLAAETASGTLRPGDRVLVTHVLGSAEAIVAGLLAPMAAGAPVIMARNLERHTDVELVAQEKVTHVMGDEPPFPLVPLAR